MFHVNPYVMGSVLTHVSLFSGIGGIDLAAERAGFTSVLQVEKDDFCRQVLEKHWPDVTRIDDVRDVSADTLRNIGLVTPTLVSGGFPCQPFSSAGLKRGKTDDRFLWPEMLRIVSDVRPTWVIGENVAGFINMELDTAIADLEREGYTARAFVLPACGVDAPHQRFRCFIVAHAGHSCGKLCRDLEGTWRVPQQVPWDRIWETIPEPCIRGVANGIPRRMDRLRALGNAVVPQQVFPILHTIANIELKLRALSND